MFSNCFESFRPPLVSSLFCLCSDKQSLLHTHPSLLIKGSIIPLHRFSRCETLEMCRKIIAGNHFCLICIRRGVLFASIWETWKSDIAPPKIGIGHKASTVNVDCCCPANKHVCPLTKYDPGVTLQLQNVSVLSLHTVAALLLQMAAYSLCYASWNCKFQGVIWVFFPSTRHAIFTHTALYICSVVAEDGTWLYFKSKNACACKDIAITKTLMCFSV